MSKRFTDTEKWRKSWFRNLEPKMKCTWEFLRDNCDVAGVWEIDVDSIEFHVKANVSLNEIVESFGDRIAILDDNKLMLTGFIEFQYGALSHECKPHRPVIKRLEKLNLLKGYQKGFERVSNTLEEKEKEKDQVKEKEKEGGVGGIEKTSEPNQSIPDAIKKFGRYRGGDAAKTLSESEWKIIKGLGGWAHVCDMKPNDLRWALRELQ